MVMQEADMHDAVEWCSFTMMFKPSSSASMYSSRYRLSSSAGLNGIAMP